MAKGEQVRNGKAFEYALAKQYYQFLREKKQEVRFVENRALEIACEYYEDFSDIEKQRFDNAAFQTLDTMMKIEPGLVAQKDTEDVLYISLNEDSEGESGDVRDVVFQRLKPSWEIGFSAKNNNDAVKHSRLGRALDFGKVWLDCPCSEIYWKEIQPIFEYLEKEIKLNATWDSLGKDKQEKVYVPLLRAFRKELLLINESNIDIPRKLINYLIGNHAFYKIIKDDSHNLVVVKAFNINGVLNRTYNGIKARYSTPRINLPTRIVEFDFKRDSDTTLNMILDGGWEISFRLHNASTKVERSLKFDIKLLGNPPILFVQHLFQ